MRNGFRWSMGLMSALLLLSGVVFHPRVVLAGQDVCVPYGGLSIPDGESCKEGETVKDITVLGLKVTCCIPKEEKNTDVTCAARAAVKFPGKVAKDSPLCVKPSEACPAGMESVDESSTCSFPSAKCCIELVDKSAGQLGTVSSTKPATPGSSSKLSDPLNLGGKGLTEVLQRIIQTFLGLVGAIAMLVFVTAGVTYMIATEEKRLSKAKAMMANATIGITIILFAYVIATTFFTVITVGL